MPNPPSASCCVRKSIATPIPGASGCWNWSTEASLPRPPSPISPRGSAPGTRRPCLRFPTAVMFFMRCTTVGPLARYLENRAYEAIDARAKLERKQATAERRHGRKDQSLAKKLSYARPAEAKAIALADEVALLARWLRDDILSVAGPEYAIRRDLFDFVVAELRARESACPHRIRPVRTLLEKQR